MKNAAELRKFKRHMKAHETPAEFAFRMRLEAAKIPHKRQVIVGFYIVDFVITHRLCAVEIDGSSHVGRESYDERRENFLRACGLHVIHVENQHVHDFDLSAFNAFPWVEAQACNRVFGAANAFRSKAMLASGRARHGRSRRVGVAPA